MQCKVRIKIGTGPIQVYLLPSVPRVGDSIILPYPSGNSYWAVIDGYNKAQDLFYAYWR